MIGILEARDDRRRMACEYKKPTTKKNKAEQSDGFGANSELIPIVTCKKHNPNPWKSKQHKTASYHGTQRYCVLCKKAGWPKRRYKSHSSEQCNSFDPDNTKNYLDWHISELDYSFKK